MRRPIVVAVDGSETSLHAAEWAAREAVRRMAPLRIVSAPGQAPRVRAPHSSPTAVTNALRGVAARSLADAVERVTEVAPEIVIDTDLLDGPPAVAVSDSGAGAQLLVVGARGAGGFSALLLGSVSGYATACAPCPVVVVREDTVAVHREIVVGVRDPDDADDALGFAFEEASLRGANLTAVHVSAPEAGAPETRPQRRLEAALRAWRQKYPEVSVTEEVVRGHPARVLADLSARSDLVIVGRHGTADGSSTRHAVLGHAHGPVAVVPTGSS